MTKRDKRFLIENIIISIILISFFLVIGWKSYAQDECFVCPKTIKEVEKSKEFKKDLNDKIGIIYWLSKTIQDTRCVLRCSYYESGNLMIETLYIGEGNDMTLSYSEDGKLETKHITKEKK